MILYIIRRSAMARITSSKQREREFRAKGPGAEAETHDEPSDDGRLSSPTPPRPDKAERRRLLREYVRWLWPHWPALLFVLVLSLFVTGLDLLWPLVIKFMVDALTDEPKPFAWLDLKTLGLIAVGLIAVKQLVDSYRSYRVSVLNARVVFRLRSRLFGKLIHLPLSQLGEMKSGGIISRLSGDVDSVGGLVQMALISPSVALIRVLLTVFVLVWLSWRLAVAALIALPILGLSSFLWLKRVRPIYRSIREDHSTIDGRVGETFGGIRVVRAFRREQREGRSYALGHHTIIRKMLYATRVELVLEAFWGLLLPLTPLLLVWYGASLVARNLATVGSIFAYQIYTMLLLQPIWAIVQSVTQTQRALAAMERIFGVLKMASDKPDAPDAVHAPGQVEEFRFEHVSFEYRPGVPVVSDFDLTVAGGMTVALVGPSGAGKTTVTDLVARFHDPTSGRVLLNGIDLRTIKLRSYRSLLAVVQQETFLFDGSVRENIAYGLRDATDAQVEHAARLANAHEFIERLPQGYDTLVGERGFKLSGGQRQRLSIARAVLANPRILILDEATSNLDTESEQLIQSSLAELYKNRTTFVIAHRLSTVTHADLIVTMDAGRIVETGTHEELLSRRGLYFEMVERQRRSFGKLDGALEAPVL
jgi:ATP-binding cassette subfamily B protein/subfamily B ATP-binding cassette protein MsbA